MKHLIGLILGLLVGVAVAVCFVYINPFAAKQSLSPLSVSDRPQLSLNFSAIANDSILFTNRRLPHRAV